MFHDTQTTIARLEELRQLGIRIAIDDFGTGYSSLGYLRRFKVDVLKIAREFIGPAGRGTAEWALPPSVVALGRTLDLRSWPRDRASRAAGAAARLGCEFGQGFLFSRPVDAAGIEAFMAARPAAVALLAPVRPIRAAPCPPARP